MERVNRTFNLSDKSIGLIKNQIQKYDLKHNTFIDKYQRVNREFGSPLQSIPLKKFKNRNQNEKRKTC